MSEQGHMDIKNLVRYEYRLMDMVEGLHGSITGACDLPAPGSRWKRRKLIKGERRFAVVLRIEYTIGGNPIVVYKYTRALKDGYGKGLCVLPPRRNNAFMSPKRFATEFEPEEGEQ